VSSYFTTSNSFCHYALSIKAIEIHNDHFSYGITIIALTKEYAYYSIKQHSLERTIDLIKFLDMLRVKKVTVNVQDDTESEKRYSIDLTWSNLTLEIVLDMTQRI
jgi:hypothetical protein